MARLTQKQIIQNLQYALADYAGRNQALVELGAALEADNNALIGQVHRLMSKTEAAGSNSKKLTPADVRRMRAEYRTTSLNQKALADIYEVNPATVSRIVRGVYHARVR